MTNLDTTEHIYFTNEDKQEECTTCGLLRSTIEATPNPSPISSKLVDTKGWEQKMRNKIIDYLNTNEDNLSKVGLILALFSSQLSELTEGIEKMKYYQFKLKDGSSRGLSLALAKLEESAFWLNKAITQND